MEEYVKRVEESAAYLRSRFKNDHVDTLIVCGSGLGSSIGGLLSEKEPIDTISYAEIPHFPQSTVPGHAGLLLCGRISMDKPKCFVMQGRAHYYEGIPMQQVVFPIRVFAYFGIKRVILTNACGSINQEIHTGNIVIIKDHIAFPCLSGLNPFVGENYPKGDRFPGMTRLWTTPCMHNCKQAVYGYLSGPQFETPAEVRALRMLGVDIVGMSTVPEAMAAKHAGIDVVVGLSLVTNECVDSHTHISHEPSHKEVLLNSTIAGTRFAETLLAVYNAMV